MKGREVPPRGHARAARGEAFKAVLSQRRRRRGEHTKRPAATTALPPLPSLSTRTLARTRTSSKEVGCCSIYGREWEASRSRREGREHENGTRGIRSTFSFMLCPALSGETPFTLRARRDVKCRKSSLTSSQGSYSSRGRSRSSGRRDHRASSRRHGPVQGLRRGRLLLASSAHVAGRSAGSTFPPAWRGWRARVGLDRALFFRMRAFGLRSFVGLFRTLLKNDE